MQLRIATVGAGYVGLVTGACLAQMGHQVVCIDKDARKIDLLNRGGIPIYEPGLDELVASNVAAGRLSFSLDLPASVQGRDAVFIAVGTPSSQSSDRADLRFVDAAAAEIAKYIDQFTVIVTKSTVPVGTNRRVKTIVERNLRAGQRAAIASNPEFLREGAAISDFMAPDRIVVGVDDDDAAEVMRRIYAPLIDKGHDFVATKIETAEIIKYAANAFLAVKISYINEIADLCEVVGADVDSVAAGIGLDHRIGKAFLKAGPGWGGSCFPKDTRALRSTADDFNVPMRVVDAAIEANSHRKASIVAKIEAACGGSVTGQTIGVLGLTFKGETDDLRESPSIDVVNELIARGAVVQAFDPSMPLKTAVALAPGAVISASPLNAAAEANVLVVLTEWRDFVKYDLTKIAQVMVDPVMLDFRNLFDETVVLASGFSNYSRLGRAPSSRRLDPAHSIMLHQDVLVSTSMLLHGEALLSRVAAA